jgi:hypothetical protein
LLFAFSLIEWFGLEWLLVRAYCGALIATAEIIDCLPVTEAPVSQRSWATGPWCLILDDVKPLPQPIGYRGELGLFAVCPRAELEAMTLTAS